MPTLRIKTAVTWLLIFPVFLSTLHAWGADAKDKETIKNAAVVLEAMLDSKAVPANLLVTANCILIERGRRSQRRNFYRVGCRQ